MLAITVKFTAISGSAARRTDGVKFPNRLIPHAKVTPALYLLSAIPVLLLSAILPSGRTLTIVGRAIDMCFGGYMRLFSAHIVESSLFPVTISALRFY